MGRVKVIGYARVSREDENIENQFVLIRKFCSERGLELATIIPDPVISGFETKPRDRPAYMTLLKTMKSLGIDTIVVESLDRIARNYDYLIEELELLRKEGVTVIPIREEFLNAILQIPDKSLRKFIYDVIVRALAFGYHKYVESVKEKTKTGLERARKQGKRLGRPPYPFPIDEIKRMLKQGYSLAEIHRILVKTNKICRKNKCMSYKTFWKKVRELIK